ncbi:uncharacterized protein LOC122394102 [Amphibalanus amphitrite]|uniref:uncharacterized protein LOC122394102 n=1 Tax=Amphibalanus amphitrite TaxID=1232801 RepID=UPI001C91D918|nr:uncharacterized protein LOC122394102 [Amphibalanus amphitrite]
MYRESLDTGILPEDWTSANVVPIYKKGSKDDPSNYRPVSLTPVPCKVLEAIIRDRLMEHLQAEGLITEAQHGFRPGRSCTATEEKDLGVIVDAELKFRRQAAAAVNKASRVMAVIRRSFSLLDKMTLPILFKTLVRPLLEYVRVINDWNSLPSSVVDADSLNSFKNRLDTHWRHLHFTPPLPYEQ